MSGNSKKRTTINIAGREYCIVSPEDTDYIQRISMQLDSRIRELSDAYFSLSSLDVTTLAALNLMDDYTKTRDELEKISAEIDGLRSALRDCQLKLRGADAGGLRELKEENRRLTEENERLKGRAGYYRANKTVGQ